MNTQDIGEASIGVCVYSTLAILYSYANMTEQAAIAMRAAVQNAEACEYARQHGKSSVQTSSSDIRDRAEKMLDRAGWQRH